MNDQSTIAFDNDKAAAFAERQVRKWLDVMATSGVVDCDRRAKTYTLPTEHAACLTRAASPNSITVTSQLVAVGAPFREYRHES